MRAVPIGRMVRGDGSLGCSRTALASALRLHLFVDVGVTVVGGQVTFDANPLWGADCIRPVTVTAFSGEIVWRQSISHDDACANTFPIVYGVPLEGERLIDPSNRALAEVLGGRSLDPGPAAPLQTDTICQVHTTTGSTGYGWGGFRLSKDRKVENPECT